MQTSSDDIILESLTRVAPGTPLREALDHIVSAGTGALIVVGDEETTDGLCDGGFSLGAPFTPQRLFELAKMDGAITLSADGGSILKANVHLVPDVHLPTSETGMRHRTAERVSRQTGALVISVSQRRELVTLYVSGEKIVLEDLDVVLSKATQELITLQRFRARLDSASERLTDLEFADTVSLGEVLDVIQSQVMVLRVAREIARHVTELGVNGRPVRLQAEELASGVGGALFTLLRDYLPATGDSEVAAVIDAVTGLPSDRMLDPAVLSKVLGFSPATDAAERIVRPRGYRVLRTVPMLPEAVADHIVERFGTLQGILGASDEELEMVAGVGSRRARAIRNGITRMRQQGSG